MKYLIQIFEKAYPIASGKLFKFLVFNFLKIDFILDHIFSIGFKSGLYGGK